jgi:protein SCO1/2
MKLAVPRVALLFGAFTAGLLVCVAAILWLVGGNSNSIVPKPAAIGGPFQLTDQDGRTVSDQSLHGKPFLVFFGFTHCPDVCPTTLFEVSEVMRSLGRDADRTAALFISVDPERDTPEKIKDYLSNFDPHLRGLTADAATVAAVAKEYRVYYKKVPLDGGDYTMDHTALVYLMDKEGRFVAPFNLKRTPEEAASELKKYL